MATPSGYWLAYLRFDLRGEARVLHLLCGSRAELDEVLGLLKAVPPGSGAELAEYVVFQGPGKVYLRDAPNFPERHVLTYASFMAAWRGTAGTGPGPAARPGPPPLVRVLETAALDRA